MKSEPNRLKLAESLYEIWRTIPNARLLTVLTILFIIAWQWTPPSGIQGLAHYLPLHTALETAAVTIAFLVVGVIWSSDRSHIGSHLIIVGSLFAGIGLFDFLHILSYKGMPDFVTPGSPDKSIDFWLAARYLAALTILFMAVRTPLPELNRLQHIGILIGILTLVALYTAVVLFAHDSMPPMFIEGQGLTPLKIGLEYGLVFLFGLAALILIMNRGHRTTYDTNALAAAALISILSELCFTLYADVADTFNLLGHLYKALAYGFIYRAVFVACVHQPYSALQEAQNKVISSERQFRLLAENATDFIYWMDTENHIIYASPAAQRITGYAPEDFVESTELLSQLVDPQDRKIFTEHLAASEGRSEYSFEFRLIHPSGETRWIAHRSAPVIDGGGNWIGRVAQNTDITKQKSNDYKIQLQNRRDAALLQLPQLEESNNEKDFLQCALELAEDLTGSKISFIHFIQNDEETIRLFTWSQRTLETYCKAQHEEHYPVSQAGIWADALRQKRPVVFNDYAHAPNKKGLPDGHAEIYRLISVPVIENGKVVMLAGVGNKATDYDDSDTETMQLVASEIWRLSQRRHNLDSLRESEQRFRDIVEVSADWVWEVDANGYYTFASDTVEEVLGYTADEIVGKTPFDFMPEGESKKIQAAFSQLAAAQKPFRDLYNLNRHKDGRLVHIMTNGTPIVDEKSGALLGYRGLDRDISLERQREGEIRKLSQAVEQSPESIVITNLNAEVEYVNEAFVRATGYQRQEVLGKNPRLLHSGNTPNETYTEMWAALSQGKPWQGEFHNKRKDGSEYIEFAIINPIRQSDGSITHYVAVKADITEKKRIAQELENYQHHLEELVEQRTTQLDAALLKAETANQAKSNFLANMSHEIRTPMNAILGLSHLLLQEAITNGQRERLEKINVSSEHLLSIINDILDLSKIEAGKLTLEQSDFHLSAVIDHIRSLVAESAKEKGLKVKVDTDSVPVWLRGDQTRLRQALLNLAGNAVKFTEQGTIWIRCKLLSDSADGLTVRFEVQDTGIGVPEDRVASLFQPFEQSDGSVTRKYGGTGLGLSITRNLAELMGGEVGVDSEPGEGSTFWFIVVLQRGHGVMPATSPSEPSTITPLEALLQRGSANILLAEDNKINREVALQLLHGAGLSVDTAINGQKAVEMAMAKPYDLILMDIQMPEMDGFEATKLILAAPENHHIPILSMSANVFEEDRLNASLAGMKDFVAKPVVPNDLYSILLKWLPEQGGNKSVPQAAALPQNLSVNGELPEALLNFNGVDLQAGLSVVQNNSDKYLQLLHQLAEDHGNDPQLIRTELSRNAIEAAQQLAHSLKGASSNLGFTVLQQSATELEQALRQQQESEVTHPLVDNLAMVMNDLIAMVAKLPAQKREEFHDITDTAQVDVVLHELETLLAVDDTRASEVLSDHSFLLHCYFGEEAEQLAQQIERFDYPLALETLRDLLKHP